MSSLPNSCPPPNDDDDDDVRDYSYYGPPPGGYPPPPGEFRQAPRNVYAEGRRHDRQTSSSDQGHQRRRHHRQHSKRRWNRGKRPKSQDKVAERTVRPRTASLTDKEEQERQQGTVNPNSATASERAVTSNNVTTKAQNLHTGSSAGCEQQELVTSMIETVESRPADVVLSIAAGASQHDVGRRVGHNSQQPAVIPSSVTSAASVPQYHSSSTLQGGGETSSDNNPTMAAPQPKSEPLSDNTVNCPFFYHEKEGDPMAFCCANCRCPPEQRARYGHYISQAAPGDYFHRHCCHKVVQHDVSNNWLPPLQELQQGMYERLEEAAMAGKEYPPPKLQTINKHQVGNRARKNTETQVKHNDEIEHPLDLLNTNERYIANQKEFSETIKKREKDLRPAVVLDVFAGVGAALVVLKRLGISMSKVVHVEHDEIAIHVVRHNHDKNHNPDAPDDGIEHAYLSRFEEMEGNLDQFLREHGPIDIIVGGPPCQDYSGINAHAQGPQGAQGQFLPRFATFIQNVQARQPEHPVYYLIENVVFIDGKRVDNYNLIENLTGTVETKLDALYFSPCKRYRSYWTNFPLEDAAHGYEKAVAIKPNSCLEEGWIFPGEDEVKCAKVNTFLASTGRINDERMEKIKPTGGSKYEKGYFSALERERMLGFPETYVQGAVQHLYGELFDNALNLQNPDENRPESIWKDRLDPKYWCFSGEPVRYEEAYNHAENAPYIRILLSPPQVTMNRELFNSEDYSKHLLGNSFSIPVVEYLMNRLRAVFATCQYEGYDYRYRWEGDTM